MLPSDEVLAVVTVRNANFWSVTPWPVTCRLLTAVCVAQSSTLNLEAIGSPETAQFIGSHFDSEYGGDKFSQNVGVPLQNSASLQPRAPYSSNSLSLNDNFCRSVGEYSLQNPVPAFSLSMYSMLAFQSRHLHWTEGTLKQRFLFLQVSVLKVHCPVG
jgi:hypothetical protein